MYKTLYNTVEIHQLCKMLYIPFIGCIKYRFPVVCTTCDNIFINTSGYATMVHGRCAIRIAVLSQTWKLRHYYVIDDVITRKL